MTSVSSRELIEKLARDSALKKEEYMKLLSGMSDRERVFLQERARQVRQAHYGRKVFTRGLIEFTNYCKNNCFYCGIRRENSRVERYHLSSEDILLCVEEGYQQGFRTFELQGGEDGFFTAEK